MENDTTAQEPVWPLRTWVLMALGALFALAIQQLADLPDSGWDWGKRLVGSAIVFLAVSGIAFGLSWRRGRHFPAAIMAVICGAISGGVMLWNGTSGGRFEFLMWPMCSGVVAAAVFLVLFQAAEVRHPHFPASWSWVGLKDWKRQALIYEDVHEAIWTDALLAGLSGIFTGITMALAFLLAAMFHLVKIDLLRELLEKNWVDALIIGGAYGGGMGLLRDRTAIISALQKVAMLVLRVLAPVLAVGLAAFLAVLPFTGLAPLWATGETTPMMLSAGVIALFLVNAVIGDKAEDAALARPLRWGAMGLALALLPLVAISAWSTGLRISQRGLSPDRLWALIFIVLAVVTAVAYAVAILRRGDWVARLYRSNLHLALILGGVSLILSTSIISFDRMATADQIARLNSGKIKPVDFDYRGLWFDFGPPGKAAIKKLAKEAENAQVRRFATAVQQKEVAESPGQIKRRRKLALDKRLTILPAPVAIDPELRDVLDSYSGCGDGETRCLLRFLPGNRKAIVVKIANEKCSFCWDQFTLVYRGRYGWRTQILLDRSGAGEPADRPKAKRLVEAVRANRMEVRSVKREQLFVEGRPLGDAFPEENSAKP